MKFGFFSNLIPGARSASAFAMIVLTFSLSACGLLGRRDGTDDELAFPDFSNSRSSVNESSFDSSLGARSSGTSPVANQFDLNSSNTSEFNASTLGPQRTAAFNRLISQGGMSPYRVGGPYRVNGQRYVPREDFSYSETGMAAWYGPGLVGNPTSSGEIFDPRLHTAAHKTLPFSSIVKVTALDTGRNLLVRINDRGPFLPGHIIDLSKGAADALGLRTSQGSRVRVDLMAEETQVLANRSGLIGSNQVLSLPSQTQVPAMPAVQPQFNNLVAPVPSVTSQPISTSPLPTPPLPGLSTQPMSTTTALPLPTPLATTRKPTLPPVQAPAIGSVGSSLQPASASNFEQGTQGLTKPAVPAKGYYVQAGSYSALENAEQVRNRLSKMGNVQIFPITSGGKQMYRVRLGPFRSAREAQSKLGAVIVSGGPDAIVVKEG